MIDLVAKPRQSGATDFRYVITWRGKPIGVLHENRATGAVQVLMGFGIANFVNKDVALDFMKTFSNKLV